MIALEIIPMKSVSCEQRSNDMEVPGGSMFMLRGKVFCLLFHEP